MKAMIIGSSGFIGSRLAAHLADQGVSVEKVRHPALDKEYVLLLNDAEIDEILNALLETKIA